VRYKHNLALLLTVADEDKPEIIAKIREFLAELEEDFGFSAKIEE